MLYKILFLIPFVFANLHTLGSDHDDKDKKNAAAQDRKTTAPIAIPVPKKTTAQRSKTEQYADFYLSNSDDTPAQSATSSTPPARETDSQADDEVENGEEYEVSFYPDGITQPSSLTRTFKKKPTGAEIVDDINGAKAFAHRATLKNLRIQKVELTSLQSASMIEGKPSPAQFQTLAAFGSRPLKVFSNEITGGLYPLYVLEVVFDAAAQKKEEERAKKKEAAALHHTNRAAGSASSSATPS